jgi:hypothetical protein
MYNKKINKESKRRKKEHVDYSRLTKEMWDELVASGGNVCFFCGEKMDHKEDFHHIKGRISENYLKREFLFPAHTLCHVWKYHSMCYEQIIKEPWYKDFLNRLSNTDTESFRKEIKKRDKYFSQSGELF